MTETIYGEKGKGKSRFIIVAPHAGKMKYKKRTIRDDVNTGEITKNIAEELKASFVINKNYIRQKPDRIKKNGFNPNILEDFNNLSWDKKKKRYDWERKCMPMKKFYNDISEFAKSIKQPVIIFIHGMQDRYGIDIDIGFGVKYDVDGILKGTKGTNKHPKAKECTGDRTADEKNMKKLEKFFKINHLKTGVGEKFVAWSKTNAAQYCSKLSEECFQLEIADKWRKKGNFVYISILIASELKSIYK